MHRQIKSRPQSKIDQILWDPALEQLLKTSNYQNATPNWSHRNIYYMVETNSFMEAIGHGQTSPQNNSCDDATRSKENRIRHIIQKPLSPRKPLIIPCSTNIAYQDKQKIEKVVRQRKEKIVHKTLPIKPKNEKPTLTRPTTIHGLRFSSQQSRKPTFYWGA